jgi:hypothetical protein
MEIAYRLVAFVMLLFLLIGLLATIRFLASRISPVILSLQLSAASSGLIRLLCLMFLLRLRCQTFWPRDLRTSNLYWIQHSRCPRWLSVVKWLGVISLESYGPHGLGLLDGEANAAVLLVL